VTGPQRRLGALLEELRVGMGDLVLENPQAFLDGAGAAVRGGLISRRGSVLSAP
jgi:hypothetical protein